MRAWISFFTSFWMPSGTAGATRGSLALMGAIGGKGWVGRDCVDKGPIGDDEGGAASIGTRSTGAALASSGGCIGVTRGSLPSDLASAALALSSLLPATD